MKKYMLAAIGLFTLLGTSLSGGDQDVGPWWIRAAVVAGEDHCEGGAVVLHVDSLLSESFRILVDPAEFQFDAEWSPPSLKAGPHTLHAQLVSCRGVPGQIMSLGFDYDPHNRRKEIYVGLRYDKSRLNLDYLEVSTTWDGSEFFTVTRDGENIVVTNISNVELRRCEYLWAFVNEEYYVEGNEWGPYNLGGQRDWPESVESLKPGKSLVLEPDGIIVVRKGGKSPRLVKPTKKRFVITVQPRRTHYLTVTEPKWGPVGLPTCDRYYVEYPTTDDDPSVKIWERE